MWSKITRHTAATANHRQRGQRHAFLQYHQNSWFPITFLVSVVPTTLPWITNSTDNPSPHWSDLVLYWIFFPFGLSCSEKKGSQQAFGGLETREQALDFRCASRSLFWTSFCALLLKTAEMMTVLWFLISPQDVCMLGNLISCCTEWKGGILQSKRGNTYFF